MWIDTFLQTCQDLSLKQLECFVAIWYNSKTCWDLFLDTWRNTIELSKSEKNFLTTTTTKWFLGSLRASRAIKKLTSLMKIWLTGNIIDTPMTNVHPVFQFISTHAWQCIFKTDLVCIDCIVNDRYVCSRQCLLCPFLSLRGVGLACSSSCWPCLYVVPRTAGPSA